MKTETFSYLPDLTDEQVAKQVQYFLDKNCVPGIEYCENPNPALAYWNWWKLPLFEATSPDEVQAELEACKKAHPNAYIKVTAYDNIKQRMVMAFVVSKPQ
jgi:ribulose-bisphosphate carboxylase small chain